MGDIKTSIISPLNEVIGDTTVNDGVFNKEEGTYLFDKTIVSKLVGSSTIEDSSSDIKGIEKSFSNSEILDVDSPKYTGNFGDDYNKILGHADAFNKQGAKNLSVDQIEELASKLEPDEGFWAPIRNNGLVDDYINKAFDTPTLGDKFSNFMLNNSIYSNLSAGFGGIDQDGQPIKPVSTSNKIIDGVLQLGGSLLLMNAMGAGVQGGLGFGSTENVVNDLLMKNTGTGVDALSKIVQYGVKSGTNAGELGYFNGINTGLQGGTDKEILDSAIEGAKFGAIFGPLSKVVGEEVIPKVIDVTIPESAKIAALNETFGDNKVAGKVEDIADTKGVGEDERVFKNVGEYFDYINNIGKRLDLSSQDKIKAIQKAYEALAMRKEI